MPHVKLSTPTGVIELHYNIATPTTPSSATIDPRLPCVLFLHSGYLGQEIFETQFSDPTLRTRFNLIGVDMRGYGKTKGMIRKQGYSPSDSADDIYRFIKVLDLPSLHIFGLAVGCCVALEIAAAYPDVVLSLTLCSPLPLTEPEDIAAGRLEVFNLWMQAFNHDGTSLPVKADQDVLNDLVHGAQQLCYNNESTHLTEALKEIAVEQAIIYRAGTPEKLAQSYSASVGWFLNRRPLPRTALSKIRSRIRLIHCEDDIAYPLRYAEELQLLLQHAGVDVELCEVPGPHYGNVLNPQYINPIILEVVLSLSSSNKTSDISQHSLVPCDHQPIGWQKVLTPYTKQLAKYGYDPCDNESESDLDW